MLYLVATPIGNLADMTYRAVEILKQSHYILCEDTRHSRLLLNHYQITTPLHSYHKFNEAAKEQAIILDLQANQTIALISDAGTPGIADPGHRLVQKCLIEKIQVSAIPGACAAITALTCSGLATDLFQFFGFLPKAQVALKKALVEQILDYTGTTICYESPHRVLAVLTLLHELVPEREIVLARELTKKFEEVVRGTANFLLNYYQTHLLKGECILLIAGKGNEVATDWQLLTPEEHVNLLMSTYQLSSTEAVKLAAKQRGVPKRILYKQTQC